MSGPGTRLETPRLIIRSYQERDAEPWMAMMSDPEVELAYHFSRDSWNKGYATEAASAVLTHAFGRVGLDRVIALVVPGNVASWHVLEKAGMRYEGLADYFGLNGLKKYAAGRVSRPDDTRHAR